MSVRENLKIKNNIMNLLRKIVNGILWGLFGWVIYLSVWIVSGQEPTFSLNKVVVLFLIAGVVISLIGSRNEKY